MKFDIETEIKGFGFVAYDHRDMDAVINEYMPNSLFGLREEIQEIWGKDIPVCSVSEGLMILAFAEKEDRIVDERRFG